MKVLAAAITELYDAVAVVVEALQAVALTVADELFVVELLTVELACELVEAADCVLVDDATEVELCDACEAELWLAELCEVAELVTALELACEATELVEALEVTLLALAVEVLLD